MLSKSIIIYFIGMLACSTIVHAESNENISAYSLTLQEAVTKTFENNPMLRTFSYQLKAQAGRQYQAGLGASSELNLSLDDALGSNSYNSTEKAQATLSIVWVVEGDIRQGYIDVANAESLALNTESKIQRLDIAAKTTRLYLIVLANQSRLSNARKTLKLTKETVSTVKKRVTAGRTPDAELARAEADYARRQLEQEDIEHELLSSIYLLSAQWGETNPTFTHVEGELTSLPAMISFESLKKNIDTNPEFIRFLSNKRLKQAEYFLAKAKSSPEWKVKLGVRHFEFTDDQALVAGVSIPFGERSRNTGRIAEAHAKLSQTEAKENELRVRFETTLFILYQELQHNLHKVETYQSKIIPRLQRALRETRRAYNAGRYSYLELQSIQVELLEARNALVQGGIDAHLKSIDIERLTGTRITQPNIKK